MAKFENVFKQIGTFGYPLVQKIERQFYQWKHTGNMCKHLVENDRFCRDCEQDECLIETFFDNHLDGSCLFHPYCDECDRIKAERTSDRHCHHLNPKGLECEFCWRETDLELSLLNDPIRMKAYRMKLVGTKHGIECMEICDDCGSKSTVFIRS